MKNKFLLLICSLLTIVLTIAGTVRVFGNENTVGRAEKLAGGIMSFKMSKAETDSAQAWLDGELAANAGASSEWYVLSLMGIWGDSLDYGRYADALAKYVEENTVTSASTREKLALLLIACGKTEHPFVGATAEDAIGEQGIMSLVFGLHLLNNDAVSQKNTTESVIARILTLVKPDGGWAVMGTESDVDTTAMVLQALAKHYGESQEVAAAVDRALVFISDSQADNGGFLSYGNENPESASQVLIALCALGIDAGEDTRFIKNGYTVIDSIERFRLEDGSFTHTPGGSFNEMSTYQALCAFSAVLKHNSGAGELYDVVRKAVATPVPTAALTETATPTPTQEISYATDTPLYVETGTPTPASESNAPSDNINISNHSYKLYACIVIVIIMAVVSLILILCRKSLKNILFVLIVGAVAIAVVLFTNVMGTKDYYSQNGQKTDVSGSVSITIRCDTVVGRSDKDYIPADGVILAVTEMDISQGDTVYDVLIEAAAKYGLKVDHSGSGTYVYISGINYIYEFDFGELSGWMYHVNGNEPNVGCGAYTLSDGDVIEWLYTCNLGEDLK